MNANEGTHSDGPLGSRVLDGPRRASLRDEDCLPEGRRRSPHRSRIRTNARGARKPAGVERPTGSLASQRGHPTRMLEHGFSFADTDLDATLARLVRSG
ncbi:MAG: DUF1731 domain-containing protein [Planctomycetes bacterium]|nr:DUF1731 domain-containing protein [Planctomycetota bacterium]